MFASFSFYFSLPKSGTKRVTSAPQLWRPCAGGSTRASIFQKTSSRFSIDILFRSVFFSGLHDYLASPINQSMRFAFCCLLFDRWGRMISLQCISEYIVGSIFGCLQPFRFNPTGGRAGARFVRTFPFLFVFSGFCFEHVRARKKHKRNTRREIPRHVHQNPRAKKTNKNIKRTFQEILPNRLTKFC